MLFCVQLFRKLFRRGDKNQKLKIHEFYWVRKLILHVQHDMWVMLVHFGCLLYVLACACWWWNSFKVNYFHGILKFVKVTDTDTEFCKSFIHPLHPPDVAHIINYAVGVCTEHRHAQHDFPVSTVNLSMSFHFQYHSRHFFSIVTCKKTEWICIITQ